LLEQKVWLHDPALAPVRAAAAAVATSGAAVAVVVVESYKCPAGIPGSMLGSCCDASVPWLLMAMGMWLLLWAAAGVGSGRVGYETTSNPTQLPAASGWIPIGPYDS